MAQIYYKSEHISASVDCSKEMQIYFEVRHKTISQIWRRLKVHETLGLGYSFNNFCFCSFFNELKWLLLKKRKKKLKLKLF